MPKSGILIWKYTPMLRVLLPLTIGILWQYYFNISLSQSLLLFMLGILVLVFYLLLNLASKFFFSWVSGLAIQLLFISLGSGLLFVKNSKNHPGWIGHYLQQSRLFILTIKEPLIERSKSYKTLAKADFAFINHKWEPVEGDVLIYIKKGPATLSIEPGLQIILNGDLQPIPNSGNPASFNYQRYCAFQNIFAQVFLKGNEFEFLSKETNFSLNCWLANTRLKVLSILRKYVDKPNQISIAEALLIGYREDLDRDLVAAYSNTGVVHIIAISGLHIAMIYALILFLFKPLQRIRGIKYVQPIVILWVIWVFTLLAGAVPSILRSAVMFSFIVLGENFGRRINIYNNLAASAFTILILNPYSLWDVGFQLSYAAVLGIVVFSKYIFNWVGLQNKLLKYLWQLNAVTISAQIFTLPIILYSFHQFPLFFLFSNMLVVPLSGLILYAEILLLFISPFSNLALSMGKLIGWSIGIMNHFIERINLIPFSAWKSIQVSIVQELILYGIIVSIAWWLIYKQGKGFLLAMSLLLIFIGLRSFDFIKRTHQEKLIVYNIPQHEAIDVIDGRSYFFIGDSLLWKEGFLQNFYLIPSRTMHRIFPAEKLSNIDVYHNLISSNHKTILLIDRPLRNCAQMPKIKVDALIITQNPDILVAQLAQQFDSDQYIFDASNPLWKINKWKKECENLHLRHYSIPEQGAFMMEL